jgi:hypothetical protein
MLAEVSRSTTRSIASPDWAGTKKTMPSISIIRNKGFFIITFLL